VKPYSTFIFESYSFDANHGEIQLNYSLDGELQFTETLKLPHLKHVAYDKELLNRALFALHMIGGISYYKTCLPKTIKIKSGKLSQEEANFWNSVYKNGLGEFFYKNQIDFRDLIHFPAEPGFKEPLSSLSSLSPNQRVLVPIGGGKDSAVTLELLRAAGHEVALFRLGQHPFIDAFAERANVPLLTADRHLSPLLFELNAKGALNGHVPITAYVSIMSYIMSILYGYEAVVMSNEASASYGNVQYLGQEINHQWSKGLEFEQRLQKYLHETVGTNIGYFSLLRPMTELMITKLFSNYPQYFDVTTSCNTNWRIIKDKPNDRWCGTCPKCAFVFAMLAAFVPKQTVVEMFGGKNLLEDEKLLPLFRQLLNIEGFKPFECVGTPEETLAALVLAAETREWDDAVIIKMAQEEADIPQDMHALIEQELTVSDEHAIPEPFEKTLLFVHAHS